MLALLSCPSHSVRSIDQPDALLVPYQSIPTHPVPQRDKCMAILLMYQCLLASEYLHYQNRAFAKALPCLPLQFCSSIVQRIATFVNVSDSPLFYRVPLTEPIIASLLMVR